MSVRLARHAIQALWDLLAPRDCLHCGTPLEEPSRALCPPCAQSRLEIVDPPCCQRCGYPFAGIVMLARDCPHCREIDPVHTEARTLFLFRGAGRSLVHALKYEGQFDALAEMEIAAQRCQGLAGFLRGAVLVPVPLHPSRERRRGFNQSLVIARCLARLAPGCRVVPLLERVKRTRTQTHLRREERLVNIKGAFRVRSGRAAYLRQRLIVVDDVFTTGSTLNECCHCLYDAGARRLAVLTCGHG